MKFLSLTLIISCLVGSTFAVRAMDKEWNLDDPTSFAQAPVQVTVQQAVIPGTVEPIAAPTKPLKSLLDDSGDSWLKMMQEEARNEKEKDIRSMLKILNAHIPNIVPVQKIILSYDSLMQKECEIPVPSGIEHPQKLFFSNTLNELMFVAAEKMATSQATYAKPRSCKMLNADTISHEDGKDWFVAYLGRNKAYVRIGRGHACVDNCLTPSGSGYAYKIAFNKNKDRPFHDIPIIVHSCDKPWDIYIALGSFAGNPCLAIGYDYFKKIDLWDIKTKKRLATVVDKVAESHHWHKDKYAAQPEKVVLCERNNGLWLVRANKDTLYSVPLVTPAGAAPSSNNPITLSGTVCKMIKAPGKDAVLVALVKDGGDRDAIVQEVSLTNGSVTELFRSALPIKSMTADCTGNIFTFSEGFMESEPCVQKFVLMDQNAGKPSAPTATSSDPGDAKSNASTDA